LDLGSRCSQKDLGGWLVFYEFPARIYCKVHVLEVIWNGKRFLCYFLAVISRWRQRRRE